MKTQKQTLKFFSAIIVSSLIGGLLGWFIIHFETEIYHGLIDVQNLILHNNLYIQFFISGLCGLQILILFFSAKDKLNRLDSNDDVIFNQIDHQLGVLLPLISATMIIGFCLFGTTVTNALNEPVHVGLILFLLNITFALIMIYSISIMKIQ